MANFGHHRERQIKKLLEEEGWFVIRAPASLGVADLVAIKDNDEGASRVRLIECKATKAGPYAGFGPADRKELLDTANGISAWAELAWWPKRGNLVWIRSEAWPK